MGWSANRSTNSVRRRGIQLELHHSRNHSAPPNGAGGVFAPLIYKHVTPNGVKSGKMPIDKVLGSR
jgi:hypothetical protein